MLQFQKLKSSYVIITMVLLMGCATAQKPTKKLKALIIDGENSHGVWPKTTMMLKDYLEQTGMFEVDVDRTFYTWQGPHYNKMSGIDDIKELLTLYPIKSEKQHIAVDKSTPDPNYSPNFEKYDVVISNFGWKASNWPEATKTNFENYMKNGGGFVVVHAADNSWGNWEAFNKMIGIGGWDDRTEKSGPYLYYGDNLVLQKDRSEGNGGSHGPQHEFVLDTRAPEHPIMKGLPASWMHAKDELYERLRGPAENVTVLATGYSDVGDKATKRHEPLLMTIDYGKGRTFHSTLGHMDYSMECVGFITTFQRGAEWAATGKVTQKVPSDFPTSDVVSIRKWGE
uniref:ThuA domain-containing protein n=1 Tax=Mariniflexile sp. TaxID=1979402 RepID=UPI0040489918